MVDLVFSLLGDSSDSSDSNYAQEDPNETPKVNQGHEVNCDNKTNQVFQAYPGRHFNLTLFGQHTDPSSSKGDDHRSATFSNDANTNHIFSVIETINEQSLHCYAM